MKKTALLILSVTFLLSVHAQTWTNADSFVSARGSHTATILQSGEVLIAGGFNGAIFINSAELYDPTGDSWGTAGAFTGVRGAHAAVLLPDGKVLVVGGFDGANSVNTAAIYDPIGNIWTTANSMVTARQYPTATLLGNGKVLVTGGANSSAATVYSSAELYDPVGNSWTSAGSMTDTRYAHQAVMLQNGDVLVIGGDHASGTRNTAEVYNVTGNSWSSAGTMSSARAFFAATILTNGKVLASGGWNGTGESNSADLYDPTGNNWSAAGTFTTARERHATALLPSGDVLLCGGLDNSFNTLTTAYIYSVSGNSWSATTAMNAARYSHTCSVLPNGGLLAAGGGAPVNSSEIFSQPCSSTASSQTASACNSYASPSGNYTWTSSGVYMDTVTNTAGCDSIITVNLTVNSVDTSVTLVGSVALTSNDSGATYQWLNCDSGLSIVVGATSQTFNPTVIASYAVEVTANGCVDTSACYPVMWFGILESGFGASLIVYPNPTKGTFNIDLRQQYKEVTVTIRTLAGQIISSTQYETVDKLVLDLDGARGFYFVDIQTADGKLARLKVLKN